MKTKLTILLVLIASICYSQSKGINYKALIKDGGGNVVASQNVDIQFIIYQGPGETNNVYQETHTIMTDANGIIIVNIGEGTPDSGDYSTIHWDSDDHYLNVQIDTGGGLTNMGTTKFMAVPYALHAANVSGLEALNEGNGTGWRLIGSNPNNFGNIGDRAIDLSYSSLNGDYGATGNLSTSIGAFITASGNYSTAMGYSTQATGAYSTALGFETQADGDYSTAAGNYAAAIATNSTAIGLGVIADDENSTVLGTFNDPNTSSATLFQVGNGSLATPSNAFTIFQNGTITAPSFDMGEITDPKALITKEFADANYSGGGTLTGLEAMDEGNGIGWRLIGRDPANYGNIGLDAIDLSYSPNNSDTSGATGQYSTAMGFLTTASGSGSTAMGVGTIASGGSGSTAMGSNSTASGLKSTSMGHLTIASGENSIAMGQNSHASGNTSTAIGFNTESIGNYSVAIGTSTQSESQYSIAVGFNNVGGGNPGLWGPTDPLFEIGNGINGIRSNALTVLKNGTITAPSFDLAEIIDAKALITKEYLEANSINPTGLEAIDEGNGIGWRLIGRDPNNYGNIGSGAVDLSISNTFSINNGAKGEGSIAIGNSVIAAGLFSTAIGFSNYAIADYSTALGLLTLASGDYSFAMGYDTTASGIFSTAMGIITKSESYGSTAIGFYNVGGGTFNTWIETDPLLEIGNGTLAVPSNALTILKNGTITAPSFDLAEITDPKALITKEYADANYLGGGGSATGLEAIDEGNGIGWRLIGSDPANFGNIGLDAVDLSVNTDEPSTTAGATGRSSFAAGEFSEASGIGSMAIGGGIASGIRSIAIGNGSNATVDESLAIGSGTASGYQALAMGYNTTASGQNATALGIGTTAMASWSTAMGINTTASGAGATATGTNTTAQGWYSFTSGNNSLASGSNSAAMGQATTASGFYSFAMGDRTKAEAYGSTAIGHFNIGGGTPNTLVVTDPLFEIGNGTSDVSRNNALTVFRNGNATLAGTLTQNSDRRLKTNITELQYGLNTILQLNPVSYNWKKQPEQTQQSLGLIAQEVQPLIKEIVKIGIDKDQTLSLSYIELIPVLIKAIQEQQDIIKVQDSKINGLTAELEQLKTLDQRVKQLEVLTNGQQ